jgi:hypothetical protein
MGLSRAGLPIGVQVMGGHLEDRTTIAFAGLLEREFGGLTPAALAQALARFAHLARADGWPERWVSTAKARQRRDSTDDRKTEQDRAPRRAGHAGPFVSSCFRGS